MGRRGLEAGAARPFGPAGGAPGGRVARAAEVWSAGRAEIRRELHAWRAFDLLTARQSGMAKEGRGTRERRDAARRRERHRPAKCPAKCPIELWIDRALQLYMIRCPKCGVSTSSVTKQVPGRGYGMFVCSGCGHVRASKLARRLEVLVALIRDSHSACA